MHVIRHDLSKEMSAHIPDEYAQGRGMGRTSWQNEANFPAIGAACKGVIFLFAPPPPVLMPLHSLSMTIPRRLTAEARYAAGLLGGAVYVNAFTLISKDVDPKYREFSLAAASLGDSLGIAMADATGILIQVCACPHVPGLRGGGGGGTRYRSRLAHMFDCDTSRTIHRRARHVVKWKWRGCGGDCTGPL